MAQIFISYSRVDKRFVDDLAEKLRRIYGYTEVWFDEGLHGGDIWWEEILDQIASCDIFIYVLSNDSIQSKYCQAEFTEARRLRKQIITVQARDRTKLTDELGDIHYIDMSGGVGDSDALTDLFRSINKRQSKVSRWRQKPLWEPRTPKPGKEIEKSRSDNAPDVDTPKLDVPDAEREKTASTPPSKWWQRPEITIPASTAIVVALITGVFGLWQGVFANNADTPIPPQPTTAVAQNPTQSDADATAIAAAELELTDLAATATHTATEQPSNTPSPNPTPTLTTTQPPEINPVDATLTAIAQMFDMETATRAAVLAPTQTQRVTETLIVEATATQQQVHINQTATQNAIETEVAERLATAITWTPTPTNTPNATATLIAFRPQTNADWTPIEREFDGVTMVLVPAGCFDMGSEEGNSDEQPVHEICFYEAFWIDHTEVTRAQYQACLDAGVCEETPDSDFSTQDNQPINNINWFQAQNYCEWRGGRLPTEAEWEYAARGPDRLIFPWGNVYYGALVIGENDPTYGDTRTAPVGRRADGASWVGALDMAGNVWEWTSSLYMDYPYGDDHESNSDTGTRRVLRGGSFNFATNTLRSAIRSLGLPDLVSYSNGFRCARDIENAQADIDSSLTTNNDEVDDTATPTNTPDPLQVAFTPVTRNADWTPVERDFDGVTMVLVPAGCFPFSASADEQRCIDEPFWIDQTEVTNQEYGLAGFWGVPGDLKPRDSISQSVARAYCSRRPNGFLPSERQWEYAARGPDGNEYPWGNTFDPDRVVYAINADQPRTVGEIENGQSWVGAYDLSGNLWEWTSTNVASFGVARGGSWDTSEPALNLRSQENRLRISPNPDSVELLYLIGFRCARPID